MLKAFMFYFKSHAIFEQQQIKLHPKNPVRQLQRLSDGHAGKVPSVPCVDSSRAIEARGLLAQVKSFHFLLCLIMFDRVLTCSKHLSDVLQCPTLDLGKASDLVSSTIDYLEIFRSDEEWDKLSIRGKI